MSPVWILKRLVSVFVNPCHLLSPLLSLSQFGRGRLSLVAISFYALSLLFGPCCLSEFTLAGPLSTIKPSQNLLSTPGIRMHTYVPFIEREQQWGEVPKGRLLQIQSNKSTKGNFKFGIEMNNLGFWEAKWIQSFLVNWYNVCTH